MLQCPYDYERAKLIVWEMTDLLVLDLVDKGLVTDQMILTVGYDIENLTHPDIRKLYKGEIVTDHFGRKIPKHAHGTANIGRLTSSTMLIMDAVIELFDRIIDKNLLIKRIYITACHVIEENTVTEKPAFEQLNLFTDYDALEKRKQEEEAKLKREKQLQQAMLGIQKNTAKMRF